MTRPSLLGSSEQKEKSKMRKTKSKLLQEIMRKDVSPHVEKEFLEDRDREQLRIKREEIRSLNIARQNTDKANNVE